MGQCLTPDIKANKPRKALCLSEMRGLFFFFKKNKKREREYLKPPNGLLCLSLMFLNDLLWFSGITLPYITWE